MAPNSRPSALPLLAIRDNIRGQLAASRRIFVIVQRIAEVAKGTDDAELRKSLEEIMRDLLETGRELSDGATDTGNQVIDYIKTLDWRQDKSEPA